MKTRMTQDIKVSGVSKQFGEKAILNGFHATFPVGQVSVIMGPSGCGKTTLLQILMGLIPPDEGQVMGVPSHRSAVFQEDRLCETFSAVANVQLACGRKVSRAQILDHLENVGLAGSLYQPVSELSGGMRRRVAMVRAMLAPSDIVFLDEPFKGLDERTRDEAIAYVRGALRDRTAIAVTHSREEAELLGGNLMQMDNGVGKVGTACERVIL